jgi:hypothetical protein
MATAASSWVDESTVGGGSVTSNAAKRARKPLTRKEKINEELKLLEWHKMANDAAIKAALMQNKQLKDAVPDVAPLHSEDDARWMRKVVQEEHIKPLEVNKEYVLEYERREKENEERLTAQVERHIDTLQNLRKKLEEKQSMKSRIDEYRSWKRGYSNTKQGVMAGKTLKDIAREEEEAKMKLSKQNTGPVKQAEWVKKANKPTELSNVLDSLNKLAELETRITSLETDNKYEQLKNQERPSADRRTIQEFKKARAPMKEGPMAVTYEMRTKQKSWQVKLPANKRNKTQPGRQPSNSTRGAGNSGTFLTGGDDDYGDGDPAFEARVQKKKINMGASQGQQNLRSRIQTKKIRMREQQVGRKKHESALGELNRRRNEQQIQKRPRRGTQGASGAAKKGISSGVRTNNRHMADFQKQKNNFRDRKSKYIHDHPYCCH